MKTCWMYMTLLGENEKGRGRLFSGVSSNRTTGNEWHLKFHLCRKEHFFIVRMVKQWSRAPKWAVDSLPLETL